MSRFLYPAGFTTWHTSWPDDDHVWMLLNGNNDYHPTDDSLADLAPYESTIPGYTRQAATNLWRHVLDVDQQRWIYATGLPVFAGLAAGSDIGALVLADVTADLPLAIWTFPTPVSTDGTDLTFNFPDAQQVDASAPAGTHTILVYTASE